MTNTIIKKTMVRSSLSILFSNLLLTITGVLTGLLIPNILGVSQYGYFETFTLYASYSTFFQLGFINGIYLFFGDKNLEELDRMRFRTFFRFFFLLQVIIAALLLISGIFVLFQNKIFGSILLFLSVYGLSYNLMTYFQLLSQTTLRFKEFSGRTIVQSVLKILIVAITVLVFFFTNKTNVNYLVYLSLYVGMFVFLAAWYVITYRDLVFGESYKITECKKEIISLFKLGIPLLIADAIVVLIYRVDRQVVNIGFSNEEFAYFSFAYSLVSLVTTLVYSISTTIYPILKRTSKEDLPRVVPSFHSVVVLISAFFASAYFAVCFFLERFMPKYAEAIPILLLVFPTIIISSSINITFQNVFKVTNSNVSYSIIALFVLGLAIGSDILAFFLFRQMVFVVLASILSFVVWYFFCVFYIKRKLNIQVGKGTVLLFLLFVFFFFVAGFCKNYILGFVLYATIVFICGLGFIDPRLLRNIRFGKKNRFFRKMGRAIYRFADVKASAVNRKLVFGFCACSFVGLLSVNALGGLMPGADIESVATAVSSEADKSDLHFVYSSLFSTEENQSFGSFFANSRTLLNSDLKKAATTFLECKTSENFSPFVIYYGNGQNIALSTLSSPSNNFSDFNYGLELFDGVELLDNRDSNPHSCVYITEGVARELLSIDVVDEYQGEYRELINRQYDCFTPNNGISAFTILGVIKDQSISGLRAVYGNRFAITNYAFSLYYLNFQKKAVSFLYYPGRVSLNTHMWITKSVTNALGGYSQFYYDYDNGSFVVGHLQRQVNAIEKMLNSQTYRLSLAAIILLFDIVVFSLFCSFCKKHRQESACFKGGMPFAFIFVMLFVCILLLSIDFVSAGSLFLLFTNYNGMSLMFIVFLFGLGIMLIENKKQSGNCNILFTEINV